MSRLTIWSAGAGSGKTFTICEELAKRIAAGGIDPARIVATTFTTRAAAELKGRIAARILADATLPTARRVELAERLELALAGTVHSVGHRLLRRHALRLGISPSLEVIDESATDRHLERLLGELEPAPWERLTALAVRLSIEKPHEEALRLLALQRANAIGDDDLERQVGESVERLIAVANPGGGNASGGRTDLAPVAGRALAAIERLADRTQKTDDAKGKLARLARLAEPCWADHAAAAGIFAGKSSGADAALEELRRFGSDVLGRSELAADLREWGKLLAGGARELGRRWAAWKGDRGLVDYVDLETGLLELLGRSDLEADLRREIALVVVDELQDTNPIQLAIFLRLRDLAEESLWVGDRKQAIYGFRGSDSELVSRATAGSGGTPRTLEKNWRSVAPIVRLAGELFAPRFGEEARLRPVRPDAPAAVERWILNPSESRPKGDREAAAIAVGIDDLVRSGIRPGDVAVLARTGAGAERIASALARLGLPVAIGLPGLLSRREAALAVAGLRLVADRRDGFAAATILHLLAGSEDERRESLRDRLRRLQAAPVDERRRPFADHPLLRPLEAIDSRGLPPAAVLSAVIEALDLPGRIAGWGDAARRIGHLEALVSLASAWQEEARGSGVGVTVSGLIFRLEGLAASGEDEIPPPRGLDAVEVLTYHGAKGLEWPVVVLGQLEYERAPDLFEPAVSGGKPEEGRPLEGRQIRLWPWPFGTGSYGRPASGAGLLEAARESAEGHDAEAAADAEALRLLYVGITRARDRIVFPTRPKAKGWIALLPGLDALLDPTLPPGEHPVPALGSTFRIRHLEQAEAERRSRPAALTERWIAPSSNGPPSAQQLRWLSPSGAMPDDPTPRRIAEVASLPGAAPIPARLASSDDVSRLGSAIHSFLAALPSLRGASPALRERVAARCLAGWGVDGAMAPAQLARMGTRLEEWIAARWPGARLLAEVPVSAPRAAGGHWRGTADLVVELPGGGAIVVDHKTGLAESRRTGIAPPAYAAQLDAYREAFAAAGRPLEELWLHDALAGIALRI
jgi:superfamily I DNA/RNA helicase